MKWTIRQVETNLGVTRRTVTNWINEDPPAPSTLKRRARTFDSIALVAWLRDREVRHARLAWEKERPQNDEVKQARDRKTIGEARLVELQVEEAEGRLIPLDTHEECVETLTMRLAAQCKGLDRFISHVQRAMTDSEAKVVLDGVSDALLASLRAVADDLDPADVPAHTPTVDVVAA